MKDRSKSPTQRGHSGPVEVPATFDDDAPTTVEPSARFPESSKPPGPPSAQIQAVSVKAQHDSGPVMKVVSMKTPMDQAAADGPAKTPIVPRPKLRAISEITPLPHAQPKNLGYLAPPRDPAEVRSRRVRDLVIWSCVVVMLASVVALVIWFVAR